jgi:hypothetical protein
VIKGDTLVLVELGPAGHQGPVSAIFVGLPLGLHHAAEHNTLAWVYLNASGIVKVTNTGMPYPVYVLTGTMLWQMFTEALKPHWAS